VYFAPLLSTLDSEPYVALIGLPFLPSNSGPESKYLLTPFKSFS